MVATNPCAIRWMYPFGNEHSCIRSADHDGAHQCGCGAQAQNGDPK